MNTDTQEREDKAVDWAQRYIGGSKPQMQEREEIVRLTCRALVNFPLPTKVPDDLRRQAMHFIGDYGNGKRGTATSRAAHIIRDLLAIIEGK